MGLWERIHKDLRGLARICETLGDFGRGFARICETLGENSQGFVRIHKDS